METEDKAAFAIVGVIVSIFPILGIAYGIVAIINSVNGC